MTYYQYVSQPGANCVHRRRRFARQCIVLAKKFEFQPFYRRTRRRSCKNAALWNETSGNTEIRIVAFELLIKHRKAIFINTQSIQKIDSYYIDNLHFLGLTSSSSSSMESRAISEEIDRLVSTQNEQIMDYFSEEGEGKKKKINSISLLCLQSNYFGLR